MIGIRKGDIAATTNTGWLLLLITINCALLASVTGWPWNMIGAIAASITLALVVWIQIVLPCLRRRKRQHQRESLGILLAEGHEFEVRFANHTESAPKEEFNQWVNKVEHYLLSELGAIYVQRFQSSAGLPSSEGNIPSWEHEFLWEGAQVRLARLMEFISELRD